MTPSTPHKSDSLAQRVAETSVVADLNAKLSLNLASAKVLLPSGKTVQLDGYNAEERIACEVYARVGKLKGSQSDKLASDILKLLSIERQFGGQWRKIICFVDADAMKTLTNESWLAASAKLFGIEIYLAELPDSMRQSILQAQALQKMVNA